MRVAVLMFANISQIKNTYYYKNNAYQEFKNGQKRYLNETKYNNYRCQQNSIHLNTISGANT